MVLTRKQIESVEDFSIHLKIACQYNNLNPQVIFDSVKFIKQDISTPFEYPQAQGYIHLAAQVKATKQIHSTNVIGTKNMIDAYKKSQAKFFINFSSVAAVKDSDKVYFKTKKSALELTSGVNNVHTIVPAIVLGPGDLYKDTRRSYSLYFNSAFPFVPPTKISISSVNDICCIVMNLIKDFSAGTSIPCPYSIKLIELMKQYRAQSKYKNFPLFELPSINWIPKYNFLCGNYQIDDDVNPKLRTAPVESLKQLVKQSLYFFEH